jgi:hypothetical protein
MRLRRTGEPHIMMNKNHELQDTRESGVHSISAIRCHVKSNHGCLLTRANRSFDRWSMICASHSNGMSGD